MFTRFKCIKLTHVVVNTMSNDATILLFFCCNSKNGLFIEGRKRTNGMLLERLTFLINQLTRQIVALVLYVTSIDNKLVHSFKTPLNIVTCEPLSTLFNVVIVH